MDGCVGGWVDEWFVPVSLPGGVTQASTAGGPEQMPGHPSGEEEQTDEDGEGDTAAQAQPLGSQVGLPAAPPTPPPTPPPRSWSLCSDFRRNLRLCVPPLANLAEAGRPSHLRRAPGSLRWLGTKSRCPLSSQHRYPGGNPEHAAEGRACLDLQPGPSGQESWVLS